MVLGLSNNVDQKARDQQAKLIKDNVDKSEKNMTTLLNSIQKNARKEASVRDASDVLCKTLQNVGNEETPSMRNGIEALANGLSQITDYRDAMLTRVETRVTEPLSTYEQTCQQIKRSVTIQQKSKNVQTQQQMQLQNMQQGLNGQGSAGLAHQQADLQRAIISNISNGNKMEEMAELFERQKKIDMKKFMIDYVNSQMQFYANALECLSECKPFIENIDVEADMVWFLQGLRLPGSYNMFANQGNQYGGMVPGMQNQFQNGMVQNNGMVQGNNINQQQQSGFQSNMNLNNPQMGNPQFQSQMSLQSGFQQNGGIQNGGLQNGGIQNGGIQNGGLQSGGQQNVLQQNVIQQPQYNSAPGFIQHQPQPLQSLPTLQQSQGLPLDSRFGGSNKANESLPRSVSFNMDNNQYDDVVAEYEQQINNSEQRETRRPVWN